MTVQTISDQNFDEAVGQSKGLFVLMFGASWCQPCQEMKPVFKGMADRFNDKAAFGIADRDDIPDLRVKFGLNSYPRIYVFQDGQLVDQHVVSSRRYEEEIMIPVAPHLAP